MIKDAHVKSRNADGTYVLGCGSYECSGCKSKLFCKQKDSVFTAVNASPNDFSDSECVRIELGFGKTVMSVLIVFAIPLIFMGGALAAAFFSGHSGGIQAVFALVGLFVGLVLSAFVSRRLSASLVPVILGRSGSSGGKPDAE